MPRKPEAISRAKRNYRERNREMLRAKGRAYAEARRRAAGMPAYGTEESRLNRSKARKSAGPEHGMWKGEGAGYSAHHHWIKYHGKKTGTCGWCGSVPPARGIRKLGTEWHSLSGEHRRDLVDWVEVCPPCHRQSEAERRRVS